MYRIWNRLRYSNSLLATLPVRVFKALRRLEFPVIPGFHYALYHTVTGLRLFWRYLLRLLLWTPLFKTRLKNKPDSLFLDGGLPQLVGELGIWIGNECTISGQIAINGRSDQNHIAELHIGNNVRIGWRSDILVGKKVMIADGVQIGSKVRLMGYSGMTLSPELHASGLHDVMEQHGDIILQQNVWLADSVTVMPGVTIGEGTVVAPGSIVIEDIPPGVLAGGAPARVIRTLEPGAFAIWPLSR
ncbi:acyltransferase [Spongorhabdus nitratireducens]